MSWFEKLGGLKSVWHSISSLDSSRLPSTLGFGVSKKPSLGGVFHLGKN